MGLVDSRTKLEPLSAGFTIFFQPSEVNYLLNSYLHNDGTVFGGTSDQLGFCASLARVAREHFIVLRRPTPVSNLTSRPSQRGFIFTCNLFLLKIRSSKPASRQMPDAKNLHCGSIDDEDNSMGWMGTNAKVQLTKVNAKSCRFG